MSQAFYDRPILNSPYDYPVEHWEIDGEGHPTTKVLQGRRPAKLITPVPKPRRKKAGVTQIELGLDATGGLSDSGTEYDLTSIVNEVRGYVDRWRALPSSQWQVTPTTEALLKHWRSSDFAGLRPFFCQLEAVETIVWLTEVAPRMGRQTTKFAEQLKAANAEANPELFRIAMKLCTGAGKTTVMAMLIAWQTLNAVRSSGSKMFTRGFLIVTPGVTIRDRLRVLLPNDPDSYFGTRGIVPLSMRQDMERAVVVVTNYHAFQRRKTLDVKPQTKAAIEGRDGTLVVEETEGEMIRRVMKSLMGIRGIVVLNDEAHHCYREKALPDAKLDKEAKENNEAARVWINGLEAAKRKLGVRAIYDLSATPFFLQGSGYAEGTLFPWVVSDYSLMDGIEAGIVKLPRIPVASNISGDEVPKFRNLWDHIGKRMPKAGRGKAGAADPLDLPNELQTALDALYGHYEKVDAAWREAGIAEPPVFIVVCNNTATSKLVYDYVSGFHRASETGNASFVQGRLAMFRNYRDDGTPLDAPSTFLIDSEQLKSGEGLSDTFKALVAPQIERFRNEVVQRTGDVRAGETLTDEDLLREVMNTVGRVGRLGESIRCVVSVSMLTEGWDANTVTHVLGVRAFGTQLLCEQVVGRALRRQSYQLNDEGRFNPEYADILGIPFDFASQPKVTKPTEIKPSTRVRALPERAAAEIVFPRIEGYRVELPKDRFTASFSADSTLTLTPEMVGPTITRNEGIIGEGVDLTVDHLDRVRDATIVYHLTHYLLSRHFRDPGEEPKLHLFGQFKAIAKDWVAHHFQTAGDTMRGQLLYRELADMACERISTAITAGLEGEARIIATPQSYNPTGSTRHVDFNTTKTDLWRTDARKCHVDHVVNDSGWEAELARTVESHPRVLAYVKNQGLDFTVPYQMGGNRRTYIPDFILRVDDGRDDPLNLIVEVKGFRGEDASHKAETMRAYWVPGVNNLGRFGRWSFTEFRSAHGMNADLAALIDALPARETA